MQHHFVLLDSNDVIAVTSDMQAGVTSHSHCGVTCALAGNRHYLYFTFDSAGDVCKCGSVLSKPTSGNPDVSTSVDIYLDARFKLHRLPDGEDVVLMLSEDKKTYSDARSFCLQFQNGRLFVADTLEKTKLVFDVISE